MTAEPRARARPETGITLAGLRAFVTVVEARGFGPAAERLGVSQPAVSVQVATLEQALGLLLLNRRPRVALTEPGRELYTRARLVLSRVEEMDEVVREMRQLARGQLCLGYSTAHHAMPLLARFRRSFGAVHVTMRTGNTTDLLGLIADCRVDVGIMGLEGPLEDFHTVRFARPVIALCMPADHPLAALPRVDPAAVADLPVILREPGSVTRKVFETICAGAGLRCEPALVVATGEAVVEAVRAGLGVGPVFSGTVAPGGDLAVVPFGETPPEVGVYAVSLRETLGLPAAAGFFGMLTPAEGAG